MLVVAGISAPSLFAAAARCTGTSLDDYTGNDAVIQWTSRALRQKTSEQFCYERELLVRKRTIVTWPMANIKDTLIDSHLAVYSCCYGGPRPESDTLIYGIDPVRLSTTVYRGDHESGLISATQSDGPLRWLSVVGDPVLDGSVFDLNVTLIAIQAGDVSQLTILNTSAEDIEVSFFANSSPIEHHVVRVGENLAIDDADFRRSLRRAVFLNEVIGAFVGAAVGGIKAGLYYRPPPRLFVGAALGASQNGITIRRTNGCDEIRVIDLVYARH